MSLRLEGGQSVQCPGSAGGCSNSQALYRVTHADIQARSLDPGCSRSAIRVEIATVENILSRGMIPLRRSNINWLINKQSHPTPEYAWF